MSWFIAKRLAQAKEYERKREARAIMTALGAHLKYSVANLEKALSDRGVLESVVQNLEFLSKTMGQLNGREKIRALSLFVEIAKLISGVKMSLTVNELKEMPNEQLEQEVNRLREALLGARQAPPHN